MFLLDPDPQNFARSACVVVKTNQDLLEIRHYQGGENGLVLSTFLPLIVLDDREPPQTLEIIQTLKIKEATSLSSKGAETLFRHRWTVGPELTTNLEAHTSGIVVVGVNYKLLQYIQQKLEDWSPSLPSM